MTIAIATCREYPEGDEDGAALVAAFARAGLDTVWAVWDDPEVDWTGFRATLLRSTWDYTPRRREFLAWATAVPGLVNPYPLVGWSSDKTYLRDLAAAGVPTVPTTFHPPGTDWQPGEHRQRGDDAAGDVVLKPSVGAGSRGAGRFRLPAELDAARSHAAALHAEGRTVLQQRYVEAVDTAGETAVVCLGGAVSHAARKAALLAPGTVHGLADSSAGDRRQLFVEETMAPAEPTAAERAVAGQALAYLAGRFGAAPAYARVDLLPAPGGPVVVELELVEPSLFLAYAPDPAAAADRVVAATLAASPTVTPPATPDPRGT